MCSLEALVAFCALDEGLQPGELIGLGTVPDCCGIEIGRMLRPGDEVSWRGHEGITLRSGGGAANQNSGWARS